MGKCSKRSEKENRKLVLLVLCLTEIRIVQHRSALDADMKITLSQNFPSHLNKVRKDAKSEKSTEKGNRACDNSDDDNDLKLYASMARMSSDDKRKN